MKYKGIKNGRAIESFFRYRDQINTIPIMNRKKVNGFKNCNNSNDCNYPVDICMNNQCFPNYSHYYGAIDYNEVTGKVTFNDWGLTTSHNCCIESDICPSGTRCDKSSCKCVSK